MKKVVKIISISFLCLVVVAVLIYFIFLKNPKQPELTYITAEKTVLTQEVSVTGRVQPEQSVDLSFETAGKVSRVLVEVGDVVEKGQTLVTIDSAELNAQLIQAKSQLEANQAKLEELEKGTRPEEISIAETKVENAERELASTELDLVNVKAKAETDLSNLYDGISSMLYDAYTTADDATTKQTDEMFNNDSTNNPQLTFSTSEGQTKTDAEWQRVLAGSALADLKTELDNLSTEESELDEALLNFETYLIIIRDFLTRLNDALNTATSITQTTINTYKGYVNTARSNVISEMVTIGSRKQNIAAQEITNQQNIATAEGKVTTAKNILESAEKELILKQAGSTQEQINKQKAEVKQSEANIENIKSKIAKTILYSPISGIVTQQLAKTGEIISANTLLVSVISQEEYKIEANIPEVDIVKIQENNIAKIMLDAYNNDVEFTARVELIDPAETIIEGVATYKITLYFTEFDEKIKPGMTADVNILTGKKENVIAVPSRAVITQNGKKFVRIYRPENGLSAIEEVFVETGLRGSDGNIEITKGIESGDKVITLFENR